MSSQETKISPHIGAAIDTCDDNLKQARRGRYVEAPNDDATTGAFISRLWNAPENQDLVNEFMNNELCRICALNEDPRATEYFATYMVQDYLYLKDYVKFRGLRLNTFPLIDADGLIEEARSTGNSGTWVQAQAQICAELGFPPEKLDTTEKSIAELAYGNYLQSNAGREDWFNAHIMTIPCIYGWNDLANKLENDPKTDKSSMFYEHWIKPNLSTSSVDKLSTFLDSNYQIWTSVVDTLKWQPLFRTALRLEIALFDSGLPDKRAR